MSHVNPHEQGLHQEVGLLRYNLKTRINISNSKQRLSLILHRKQMKQFGDTDRLPFMFKLHIFTRLHLTDK